MTKPRRDHDRKTVHRVVRIVELRMRKRDQRLIREILAAVTVMLDDREPVILGFTDGHRLYDADDPKKG